MEDTKSDFVVKEGNDSEISKILGKENPKQTKKSKKSVRPFREKLYKEFWERKTQYKQRVQKRKEKKDGTCEQQQTELKDISDNKQPSDKVKKKVKNKVQKSGPHKDVKRLKHAPKRDKKTSKEESKDEYPGDAPVSRKLMSKYQRGKQMQTKGTRTFHGHVKLVQNEKKLNMAVKQAARSERLLQEEPGFLIPEDGESTTNVSQSDIVQSVDITTAQKHFNLDLPQFGPYKLQYTRNGKYLLIAGSKGHVAAMDWLTKRLLCEINVMETVRDIRWLHQETMFAVAQKQWTYVYDNQGIELHCLKQLHEVLRLEFLPYHFLLASSNVNGYLYWLDVSVGQKMAGHSTGLGRLDVMCQNPQNAIICLGHPGGSVTMWSPNVNEPLVKMLCHGAAVRSIAVDSSGIYMATSGVDRKLKIWDVRKMQMLHSYQIGCGAGNMVFSQTGVLALGKGNIVEVYQDPCRQQITSPYMIQKLGTTVHGVHFCPYEDVLGVGHGEGFTSLIIPGAGEANFDAMESNPFQTKKQRREAEVQMLLDKIPADMIHLDTKMISKVDKKTFMEKVEENNKIHFKKPLAISYEPKHRMKGKGSGRKKEQRKKGVIEEHKKKTVKEIIRDKQQQHIKDKRHQAGISVSKGVLDRFKKTES
ncbi:WD repeat-containing protein 46-like isoform X1 [Saccostrea echinata]|uniref:WD repeat-containing protein 46-like isoform X1 n=1 Tax=Saccostrea echinata TaxID=191078 RepID=UPI002A80E428|nr:WD repeat-containing protein 46-like isoform X1 [Saccostrea echinata]